jgi:S1-C subfamily serine protease
VVTLDGAVGTGQTITVTFSSGETVPATLVGRDATHDIAAIKMARTGLKPVTLAAVDDVLLAEWAIVIGSPLDFRNSVILGIIRGSIARLISCPDWLRLPASCRLTLQYVPAIPAAVAST